MRLSLCLYSADMEMVDTEFGHVQSTHVRGYTETLDRQTHLMVPHSTLLTFVPTPGL